MSDPLRLTRVCSWPAFRTLTVCALVAAGAVLPRASLDAQDMPENKHLRKGFWVSVGGGGGSFGCRDCGSQRETGGTAQVALGGSFTQRFQLGGSINVWTKDVDGVTYTMSALTGVVKFYPWRRRGLYVNGGMGVGSIEVGIGNTTVSQDGATAILGAGYDFRVRPNFSITPFANAIEGTFDAGRSNFNQIGIALTWH